MTHSPQVALPHFLKAFSLQTKQGRQGTWVRSDRFVPYLLVSLNYQKNTHLLKAFSIQTKQGRQETWVRSDRYVPYMILSLNCQNILILSKRSQSKLNKDDKRRVYALTDLYHIC